MRDPRAGAIGSAMRHTPTMMKPIPAIRSGPRDSPKKYQAAAAFST